MRLATWNVNSLKVRLPRIEEWLAEVEPDVVCMQETKLADDAFPALTFHALGYETAHHGEGRWNGVAILSRIGLDDVVPGFADDGPPDAEARLLSATCGGVRVTSIYVPNGRSPTHEQYRYKLGWFDRLHRLVAAPGEAPRAVCGDFNVAPTDDDVYDPAAFVGSTHVTPPERAALGALEKEGLVDVFRRHHDASRLYSWWDYRAGDFHQHRGLRIDLILASEALAEQCRFVVIDRNARKGKLPSDHAPVVADFDV